MNDSRIAEDLSSGIKGPKKTAVRIDRKLFYPV